MVTNSTVNKQRGEAGRIKPYPPLPVLGVMGALLILAGLLSAVALFSNVDGTFFTAVERVLNGLAGCFAEAMAALLVWGGVLLVIASKRPVSFRVFSLAFLIFLLVMTLFNLLSRIGDDGFFVSYCINRSNATYAGVVRAAYKFCADYGEPAGALGMLLAMPVYRFLGTVFGTILTVLLLILMVLFLFRFNLGSRLSVVWENLRKRQQENAQKRAQQAEQQRLWEQQRQQEENLRDLQQPAYLRRSARNSAVQQIGPQPAINGNANIPPVQPNPVGAAAMFPVQPNQQPMNNSGVQLYDEVIVSDQQTSQEKHGWPALHKKPAKVHQVGLVFTPSEMGYHDDSSAAGEQPGLERSTTVTGGKRKNTSRLEDIRRRKAELLKQLEANEAARQQTESDAPSSDRSDTVPVSESPLPQEDYHPLVDEETAYRRPEEEAQENTLRMPDDPTKHTPLFAPLIDMDDEDEPDTEEPVHESRPYAYPPVDLLNLEQHHAKDTSQTDQANAGLLEETLASFNIPAKVQHITHGPAITRFAMGLTAGGINVKRILNITDNIALALSANGAIRIESQIPGTNLFGIEVPNAEVQMVTFAQVLMSPEMQQAKSPLAVCLGHDITGKPVICDLARMPHLLIAGQTGSGKSVCVNTIINSLLFRTSPEDVRMIMIDPKVVELQCYNVVPHLLIPVVSEPQKAVGALAWAVAEMEDRYNKMHTKNVRELSAYNAKLGPGEQKLPRIVIIIDELADLMMSTKRDVEESIIRLAQKARAAGIHMVVATQRPTVDVITGLIKSNVPSRIAFAVSSNTDSRTILDKPGAEKLLGRGDMLYMPTGVNAPIRVQGCFLSDSETERVVDYIGKYSHVEFDPDVLEALEKQQDDQSGMMDDGDSEGVDDRLEEAIEMVVTDGQASISMLQRRMKIGYARAGRLIDDMAARGIVSKSLGSKPREVLITREEYERIKDSLLH